MIWPFRRKSLEAGSVAAWRMELPSGRLYFDKIKALQLGYNPRDFKHYSAFTTLIHPEDYSRTMDAMKQCLSGRHRAYKAQYRIKAADGKYHVFLDRGRISRRIGGRTIIIGATVDIT